MGEKKMVGGRDENSSASGSANRVFFCLSRTVALPGYESFRVEYGEGCAVPPGEDRDEVSNRLIARVVTRLEELLDAVKERLGAT